MFTRATVIGATLAVLATAGIATAAVAHSRSASDGAWTPVSPGLSQPTAKKPATAQSKPVDKVPALEASQLQYEHESWGDPKTEVYLAIMAPKGWKKVKLPGLEAKFTSPNGLWNLRVDASHEDQLLATAVNARYALVKASTEDFRLISRGTGTTRAVNPNYRGMVFHHQTLTYTYTDPARGRRLVVDRFVSLDTNSHLLFEVTAGGRSQDSAALAAVTAKATEAFIRLP